MELVLDWRVQWVLFGLQYLSRMHGERGCLGGDSRRPCRS